MQELSRHTEKLPVKLTSEEVSEKGQRLAQLEGDLAQHIAMMKSIASTNNARKKEIEAQIFQLASVMRDGVELRDIAVKCMLDGTQVVEVREDTGAAIRPPRDPRPDEKQKRLFESEEEEEDDQLGTAESLFSSGKHTTRDPEEGDA